MLSFLHMPAGDGLLLILAWQMQLGLAGAAVILAFVFAFGSCLGSFANACAMRIVRDEDFIYARSRCRGCERPLGWWENLPIIGWLAVRGRCRSCDARIGLRYVVIELLGGLLLLAYAINLPPAMAIGFSISPGTLTSAKWYGPSTVAAVAWTAPVKYVCMNEVGVWHPALNQPCHVPVALSRSRDPPQLSDLLAFKAACHVCRGLGWYVCVCACVRVCVCVCARARTHTHAYTHTRTHTYIPTQPPAHVACGLEREQITQLGRVSATRQRDGHVAWLVQRWVPDANLVHAHVLDGRCPRHSCHGRRPVPFRRRQCARGDREPDGHRRWQVNGISQKQKAAEKFDHHISQADTRIAGPAPAAHRKPANDWQIFPPAEGAFTATASRARVNEVLVTHNAHGTGVGKGTETRPKRKDKGKDNGSTGQSKLHLPGQDQ